MSTFINEKSVSTIDSKYENDKTNIKILKINEYPYKTNQDTILSLLMKNKNNDKRRPSCKTSFTDTIIGFNFNYNSKEINQFDELNNSLSGISDFDLEKDKDDIKSEFNSSEENNSSIEEEEIFVKNKRKKEKKEDVEYEIELEKDYEEIIEKLNLKGKQ